MKIFYKHFFVISFFIIFLLNGCGIPFKDKKEKDTERSNFVDIPDTVAKPDSSLKGIKVRLPKSIENKTWSQTTNNEAHMVGHPLVAKAIKLEWKRKIGKGQSKISPISSQPVMDEENIYTIDTHAKVMSINKKNGKRKWEKKLKRKIKEKGLLNGGVAVNDTSLAVTTGSGKIFVLDKKNGAIKWDKDLKTPIRSAPIISGNIVLFLTKDNRLYAHNLNSGEVIWTHEGLEEISTFMGSSSPVVSKGIVVVTYSSGEIYALNLANGKELWNENVGLYIQKKSLENISDIRGNPVIHNNAVYAISYNGKMVSIDLNTGKRIWVSNIGGIQTPWVVSNFIFVLSKDNELICLSAKEGKVVWVSKLKEFTDFKKKEVINWTGPLLTGNMLIVTGSHGLIASISPYSGKFLGAINIKSSIEVQAVVSNKTVFFLTANGNLLAYK